MRNIVKPLCGAAEVNWCYINANHLPFPSYIAVTIGNRHVKYVRGAAEDGEALTSQLPSSGLLRFEVELNDPL